MRNALDILAEKVERIERQLRLQKTLEPRATWLYSATASATVANTTTETTLTPSGVGSLVLPANFFVPGRVVRVTAGGSFGYTSTPTIVLRTYFGAYNYGGTSVMTLAASSVSSYWWYQTNFVCRTTGASGTGAYVSRVDWIRDVAAGLSQTASATATGSIDTTAAMTIDFRAQWGTANALNTITCNVLVVEALN